MNSDSCALVVSRVPFKSTMMNLTVTIPPDIHTTTQNSTTMMDNSNLNTYPVDSFSLKLGLSISAVLFSIAFAIVIWFIRDCREILEEERYRVRRREDEEEAQKNKCDTEKRKRAIDATIIKQVSLISVL